MKYFTTGKYKIINPLQNPIAGLLRQQMLSTTSITDHASANALLHKKRANQNSALIGNN